MRLQVSCRAILSFSGCFLGHTLCNLFSCSFLKLAHDHLYGQFPEDLLEAHQDPFYDHCLSSMIPLFPSIFFSIASSIVPSMSILPFPPWLPGGLVCDPFHGSCYVLLHVRNSCHDSCHNHICGCVSTMAYSMAHSISKAICSSMDQS